MRTYIRLTLGMLLFFSFALTATAQQEQYGQASYYADAYHGKKTASGTLYDKTKMTAAHNDYPYGSMLKVTHLGNKKSVTVKVIDRGPYIKGRIVDLSRAAAQQIGLINDGVAQVKVELVKNTTKATDKLSSKGPNTPDEYTTAPNRKTAEADMKQANAEAKAKAERAKKASQAKASKAAATKKKIKTLPAFTADDADTKKEAATTTAAVKKATESAKGAATKAALPMLTQKEFQNTDLYQIQLLKPRKEGFGVQVASLSDYEGVLKKVTELQSKWFSNILISTEKKDGANLYKIILGQFETREIAEQYKKDLKKKKKMAGFVVSLGDDVPAVK